MIFKNVNLPVNMNIEKNTTIGAIVAADYRTASIFKTFGIDFCCKGGRSLSEVCETKKINPDQLIARLQNVLTVHSEHLPDFASWPTDLLVDYIEKKHHRYVTETIPVLNQFLGKIAAVHGQNHPELYKIQELFNLSAGALTMHMKKEELILFPYIRRMCKAISQHQEVQVSPIGTVVDPVKKMMEEHDTEGERFREISALTNNYTPPADGCATYKVAFQMLRDFENDLHLHVHLENNILFPQAIAMEKNKMYESAN